jgi:hypothetical protein
VHSPLSLVADLDFLEKGGEDRKEKKGKQKEERGGGSRSKMVHRGQVAEARHQHTAEVTAGGLLLRAPNRRDYDGPPHRTSMDGDNKLAAAVEVELVEGNSSSVHFADQGLDQSLKPYLRLAALSIFHLFLVSHPKSSLFFEEMQQAPRLLSGVLSRRQ